MTATLIKSLVNALGGYQKAKGGDELVFKCPKCRHRNPKFFVNIKKGKCHCFHCNFGGNVWKLLNLSSQNMGHITGSMIDTPSTPPLNVEHYFLNQATPLSGSEFFLKEAGLELGRRHISLEFVTGLNLYIRRGRFVIPIRENGVIVCWVERSFNGRLPKEISPPSTLTNKSHFLYNIDNVTSQVVVVEGILDAWRLCSFFQKRGGNNEKSAVAIMGSHVSETQIGKLLAKKPAGIYLMFDGDAAGQEGMADAARRIAKRYNPWSIEKIVLPDGKDPDDLTDGELRRLL